MERGQKWAPVKHLRGGLHLPHHLVSGSVLKVSEGRRPAVPLTKSSQKSGSDSSLSDGDL